MSLEGLIIMSNTEKTVINTGNLSFCSALGIAFIVLKLTHVINWSWWFVLMPLYIMPVIAIVILLVLAIIVILDKMLP